MSEAGLRTRKRATATDKPKVASETETSEHDEVVAKAKTDSDASSFTSALPYFGILAVIGFLCYQFPETVKGLVEPWIDFTQATLPGVSVLPVDFSADIEKRDAVVAAFKHAWLAYERDAMGDDEYHPIGQRGSNLSAAGGIGYTVVDSLDTMLIMGLDEEAARARDWVEKKLSFDRSGTFNTFETTIRVLGGLLSAYHLSNEDPLYLQKAVDLADRILPTFNTPSGLPLSSVNLATKEGIPDQDNNGLVSTAEVATLQLEFKYLSFLTDDDAYWKAAERVMSVIKAHIPTPHLVSIFMNPDIGQFVTAAIRLGSRADSYYECLLKQYLQTARSEGVYRDMYDEAMTAIFNHLVQKSIYSRYTYTAELVPEHQKGQMTWRMMPKQDHLVCFLGGSLMLGAVTTGALVENVSVPPKISELSPQGLRDWKTGVDLTQTCMETHKTATGLAPEIVHFRIPTDKQLMGGSAPVDWYIKGGAPGTPPPLDARYILRPETVESLFIAYRLSGNPKYREQGWEIFQAVEKYCRIESGGYASVLNVDELPVKYEDKMETFWMSETLKYLYLLFSDSTVIPLSDYVFNTEAHPLPVFTPSIRTGFA